MYYVGFNSPAHNISDYIEPSTAERVSIKKDMIEKMPSLHHCYHNNRALPKVMLVGMPPSSSDTVSPQPHTFLLS